ncbi:HNH/ENDO VII family nuclease [Brevibacterium sp. p3-SID960]|uniref:HNH/ENDO VII family nuclease n=1 Tax=Brevibacterium sp. p3-SID960 TaxID=2916063 RepID=UPI0021A3D213|nr:HNH/ENDO VII family nuclease [Brevibacterium sp. p3-SID960]MCT1689978.1 HNH/ENDO VII family nuclease [Brevibacterium sp. p3-SID960]
MNPRATHVRADVRERGAATIEYAGIAVVIAIIIAGLVAVPWQSTLASGFSSTLCKVFSKTASAPAPLHSTTTVAGTATAAGTATTAVAAGHAAVTAGCSSAPEDPDDALALGDDAPDAEPRPDTAPGPETQRPKGLPRDAKPTDQSVKGHDGPFYIDDDKQMYDGDGNAIPNTNPKDRPSYDTGQVEQVWENSRNQQIEDYDDGILEDIHNNPPPHAPKKDSMWVLDKHGEWREITWKPGDSRRGVWDMGHLPGHEYRKLHQRYVNGEITREEFLAEYRDPDNYRVEDPGRNRSGQDEDP